MYQFLQDEQGTAAVEYSLFVSLIGLVVAGALHAFGANLVDAFSSVNGGLTSVHLLEDSQSSRLLGES